MTSVERPIVAEAPGVRITARARGAHLMSWTTHGVDRLWMSPRSHVGQADALRGGVPVLFPQFGTFGDLVKHGFARTAEWRPVRVESEPGRAALAFQLTDSEGTRAIWPHPFRARLTISASPTDLTMALTIENQGPDAAPFTGGLHTYLAVADPQAWVSGLAGCPTWDGRSTAAPVFGGSLGDQVAALADQDLVIGAAPQEVLLHDAVLGDLQITAEGFPNRVVWNPGPGHTLPDVAPGDEARFVCIEPVALVPITLDPGATWEGTQRLKVL